MSIAAMDQLADVEFARRFVFRCSIATSNRAWTLMVDRVEDQSKQVSELSRGHRGQHQERAFRKSCLVQRVLWKSAIRERETADSGMIMTADANVLLCVKWANSLKRRKRRGEGVLGGSLTFIRRPADGNSAAAVPAPSAEQRHRFTCPAPKAD